MDQQPDVARINNGARILLWLGFLVFFAYSLQAIIDLDGIAHPRRQEAFIRMLTGFSTPDFSEGETIRLVVTEMWETIQIAFLATTISAVFAIPFTFLSARPSSFWGHGLRILLQPILYAVRAVHPLIVTLPAIVLVGIGPTAGVLALTLFSTAVLIGDFSQYAEQHTSLRWAILLKVYFPGLALKHLPVNLLIATVLGFMGGGGIGFLLQMHINLLNYRDASVAILACIIAVGGLDLLGRTVWHKIQSYRVSLPPTPGTSNLP